LHNLSQLDSIIVPLDVTEPFGKAWNISERSLDLVRKKGAFAKLLDMESVQMGTPSQIAFPVVGERGTLLGAPLTFVTMLSG
jgi:hypothetical protein